MLGPPGRDDSRSAVRLSRRCWASEKPLPTQSRAFETLKGWRASGGYGSGSRGAAETPGLFRARNAECEEEETPVSTANLFFWLVGPFGSKGYLFWVSVILGIPIGNSKDVFRVLFSFLSFPILC